MIIIDIGILIQTFTYIFVGPYVFKRTKYSPVKKLL